MTEKQLANDLLKIYKSQKSALIYINQVFDTLKFMPTPSQPLYKEYYKGVKKEIELLCKQ
jgi:hypothetical protein